MYPWISLDLVKNLGIITTAITFADTSREGERERWGRAGQPNLDRPTGFQFFPLLAVKLGSDLKPLAWTGQQGFNFSHFWQ